VGSYRGRKEKEIKEEAEHLTEIEIG